ncbi:MAG: PAS domain-containing protein, partial [Pseudomonadota bacterium]
YDDDTGLPVIGRKPTTEPDGVKMRHADNRALVRYWHALRGGRTCPDRAEVDPRHMLCDIGHLFILEDLGQGNIRFRLAGSALVDVFWMDLRGMPAQAIMAPEARESLRALISETLAEPGIGHAILHRVGTDGAAGRAAWEIVLLPLRSDRGGIDRVIGAIRALEDGEVDTAQPPVSFTIAEMEITPVSTEDSDWLRESAGMAEGADPWERALERSQRNGLRSIEGGREGEEEATPRALTRNDLKIIDGH